MLNNAPLRQKQTQIISASTNGLYINLNCDMLHSCIYIAVRSYNS